MANSDAFDRLTELAAALFGAPVALITALEPDRQWFRSNRGYGAEQTIHEESFCRHMVGSPAGSVMVVEDATLDPRFQANRLVTEEGVRFYAGAVITTADGCQDGAVCVIDTEARNAPTEAQTESLKLLAMLAGQEIDHQRLVRQKAEHTAMLEMSEAMAGLGHWRYEAASGEITWSDEVYRIHGLKPGSVDAGAASRQHAYHPEDRDLVWGLMQKALKTGEGYDVRMRLDRNGEERVTRTRARVELAEDGTVVALFGVFQDITDSVRLEREQAELVETLKLAEALAGIGSWKLDVATGRIHWSDAVYAIYGVTRETFDPQLDDAVSFYHPDDRQAVLDWCDRAIQSGEAGALRMRLIRADGEERIVASHCRPETDENGKTQSLFGVFQDITEQTRGHDRIAASEARYRLLADNSTDVIATYGLSGRFNYLSPSIEQLMGYRPDEMEGRSIGDFLPADETIRLRGVFADYLQAGPGAASPRVPYRALRKDGRMIWLEAHPKLIRDSDGRPIEFQDVVRDITETKRLEDELIAARDVAEAAARSKSEFLANMSHELRTPLTSVIGFSGLLQQSAVLPEAERRYADRIATSSEALLSVINDILDYSKLEADAVGLDPVAFDVRAMARGAASIVETQCLAKGVGLAVEMDEALPVAMMGDEGRLRQVTLNFLSNAVKFTVSGEIRLDVTRVEERMRVSVKDSGIGISPEKIDALFERFTQADASTTRVYGGTGLGLAISRRLIELMGGEIGAESRPGEGSTFWFEVPLIEAEERLEAEAGDAVLLAEGTRILLADDAPANRELVRIILSGWGVELDTVCDGAEAVQAASSGDYDLILMDVHMPVMDGMDASREIRALEGPRAATPILALTANVQPDQIEACRAAGMDGHVGKPIQIGELIGAIAGALTSSGHTGAVEAA